jgi:hypothetical protein
LAFAMDPNRLDAMATIMADRRKRAGVALSHGRAPLLGSGRRHVVMSPDPRC